MRSFATVVESHGNATTLAVLLHAYRSSPEDMHGVKETLVDAMRDVDVFIPRLPVHFTSNADPVEIAVKLIEAIDTLDTRRAEERGTAYKKIILVGHSIGALLARKIYVLACGQYPEAPFEHPITRRGWSDRVSRILLLAGTNRGWSLSDNLAWGLRLVFRTLLLMGRVLGRGRLIRAARRGGPFITELRIEWLAMLRHERPPLTIQLLGTVDDVVAPEDNLDVQTGRDFIYLEVPHTGHLNVIDFTGELGIARQRIFLRAVTAPPDELTSEYIIPSDQHPDETVEHVVFVMHGIRDRGYWTERLAQRIQHHARRANKRFERVTSSYGYFPMLPFLLFARRQANVRWFMDQYTEALAKYPRADFSFVGHSNGTYLLASALEQYSAVHFDRVVFAGSVVRTTFPWEEMVARGRIKQIRNYVATTDWVVAIFPSAYEHLRISDLGSAGFDGFTARTTALQELEYIKGRHDAGIREVAVENMDAIRRQRQALVNVRGLAAG